MNILIVDDIQTNRKLLGAILEAEGHTVTQAADGVEALEKLHANGADAIISDILMPNMDGYRLCLEIRQSEQFHQIPFIAYTATYVSAGDEQAALDLGADVYIRKPASARAILETLNRVTALKRDSKVHQDLIEGQSERVSTKLHRMQSDLASKTKIARLNQKLKKSNDKLSEVDKFKSEFLSTASHEMRTPLAIIREFASILNDGVAGALNGEQESCAVSILRNCDRLTLLIDDLLDLAKIESGKMIVQRETLDIAALLAECVADFQPRFRAKAQRLTLELEEGSIPEVLGDRGKLHQALVNLIGNARKFTESDGHVVVGARKEAGSVRVSVTDDGPGIDESQLESIFEAFTQVDRVDGPGMRGTGLGLTITQKIIQFHGGEVQVESERGRGTRFSFSLPVYSAWDEQQAFLVDHARSACNGSVTTVVAVSVQRGTPECDALSVAGTKALCDLALPRAKACPAISEDGIFLYALDSTKAISKTRISNSLASVPHIEITVFTDSNIPAPDRKIRTSKKISKYLPRSNKAVLCTS